MKYVDVDHSAVFVGTDGPGAPLIYVVDSPEHPFDVSELAAGLQCSVATVPVRDWDAALTPWPAPGLYRESTDFGGEAAVTLTELVGQAIPTIERRTGLSPARRAICGYSLGGLFALYTLTRASDLAACACLSGSVWYEGWVDYLRECELRGEGRLAFLSVGSKEKRAAPKILHAVQDNMEACASILQERGFEVDYRVGPGNHMAFVRERFAAGLQALDGFLAR